ncbi:MAG: hypothetical protein GY778_22000, partial [bacterium]|nr:hypothetical protein [bacterium]
VLPDSTTTWKFIARGITKETLPGQSDASIVTKQDFFVELSPPPMLMEGDSVRLTAKVHQHTEFKGDVRVTLKTTVGKETKEYAKNVKCKGKGVLSVAFDRVKIALPDEGGKPEIAFELEAVAGDARDVLTRTSPIRPWGMEYADSKAGMARDSRTFELELPSGQEYSGRRLTLQIGPTAQRMLIDGALGGNRPVGGSPATVRS